MDFIYSVIDTYNIPILSAFLLGILVSISPCQLATNITAVAFISKDLENNKKVLLNGLTYTLGRAITYLIITIFMYLGLSSFDFRGVFQQWGDKLIGPFLIIVGLLLLEVIKFKVKSGSKLSKISENIQKKLQDKGYLGSLLLGSLFALAFCPHSAIIFFGMFIPLIISANNPIIAPLIFSIGTGLPVTLFAFLIAFSAKKIGSTFNSIKNIELWVRKATGVIFIVIGIYFLQFLIRFLIGV